MTQAPISYIRTTAQLTQAMRPYQALSGGVVAFDTETNGLEPHANRLRLVQLYFGHGPVLVISADEVPLADIAAATRPFFVSPKWLKLAQNGKFDAKFIAQHLGFAPVRWYDTMLAEAILTAGLSEGKNGLDDIIARYFDGLVMDKGLQKSFLDNKPLTRAQIEYAAADVTLLHEVMRQQIAKLKAADSVGVAQLEFAVLPILAEVERVGVRLDAAQWAAHTAQLAEEAESRRAALVAELQPYVDAWRAEVAQARATTYEADLAEFHCLLGLWEAERDAFKAQVEQAIPLPEPPEGTRGKALAAWKAERKADIEAAKELRKRAMDAWRDEHPRPSRPARKDTDSGPMKLNSNAQLGEALVRAGVPLERNENGNWNTDKYALSYLSDEFDLAFAVQDHRRYQKLVEAFGPIPERLDSAGRLHATFRQIISTGRMACREPNLQQIPKNELGAAFRKCFVASPGYKVVGADFSQMELRILAELADEENMKRVFRDGGDLHAEMAALMFNVPVADVTKAQRSAAKQINFGIAYGLSKWGLARALNTPQPGERAKPKAERVTVAEAEAFIAAYFQANTNVRRWLDTTARRAWEWGYSETPLGRRRYLRKPQGPCPNKYDDRAGYYAWQGKKRSVERQACNHPIQGGNADVTKWALVYLAEEIRTRGKAWRILLIVHDEIVMECLAEEAEECAAVLEECMTRAGRLVLKTVPCVVEASVSDYWDH